MLAERNAMGHIPTEVDLHFDELAVPGRIQFCVSEPPAAARGHLLDNPSPIAIVHSMHHIDLGHGLAVRPAQLEVSVAMTPIT
jgi:hypothetical protein